MAIKITKLELKIRTRSKSVRVEISKILEWLDSSEEDAKQLMYDYFSPMTEENAQVHDKVFLQGIINWVPVDEKSGRPKGLLFTDRVQWIPLTRKVNAVDESKEGTILLTNKDIDLIMHRLKSKQYKTIGFSEPFTDFLINFLEQTGKWFDGFDPKEMDEEDQPILELEGTNENVKEKLHT